MWGLLGHQVVAEQRGRAHRGEEHRRCLLVLRPSGRSSGLVEVLEISRQLVNRERHRERGREGGRKRDVFTTDHHRSTIGVYVY